LGTTPPIDRLAIPPREGLLQMRLADPAPRAGCIMKNIDPHLALPFHHFCYIPENH
jgi:hypothetical protein